jgi:translation initiation factor 2 beta subunit (eIF-2beta)/eIF-5
MNNLNIVKLENGNTTPQQDKELYTGDSGFERVYNIYECSNCGSKEFNILGGNYLTVGKCLECGSEYCIHEG